MSFILKFKLSLLFRKPFAIVCGFPLIIYLFSVQIQMVLVIAMCHYVPFYLISLYFNGPFNTFR